MFFKVIAIITTCAIGRVRKAILPTFILPSVSLTTCVFDMKLMVKIEIPTKSPVARIVAIL